MDSAYGGALILSSHKSRLSGIERSDSVSVDFHKLFYVVHTPKKSLSNANAPPNTQLVLAEQLAELVVDAGLIRWLIEKNE